MLAARRSWFTGRGREARHLVPRYGQPAVAYLGRPFDTPACGGQLKANGSSLPFVVSGRAAAYRTTSGEVPPSAPYTLAMSASSPRLTFVIGAVLLLAGCATYQLPPELREPPVPDLSVAEVQAAPLDHAGQLVRWGGKILEVRNRPQVTEVEVLATALGDSGVPAVDGAGLGRFIAEIPGFLDPAEYPKDRRITVAGPVTGSRTRSVGDYPYSYPVVAATQYRIWAPPVPDPYWHRYPYYGPPFYPWGWGHPWYPWYPRWPYYW